MDAYQYFRTPITGVYLTPRVDCPASGLHCIAWALHGHGSTQLPSASHPVAFRARALAGTYARVTVHLHTVPVRQVVISVRHCLHDGRSAGRRPFARVGVLRTLHPEVRWCTSAVRLVCSPCRPHAQMPPAIAALTASMMAAAPSCHACGSGAA